MFKCDRCEKEFFEEWKLRAHVKIHVNYKCEECDKTFAYLDIKKNFTAIFTTTRKLVPMERNAYFCMKIQDFVGTMKYVNETYACTNIKGMNLKKQS